MRDIVYVNRDGENPELRYSLRSLRNLSHEQVWVFGGFPSWLNTDTTRYRQSRQNGDSYRSARAHLLAACKTEAVSDPFWLWNDDFYVMRPIQAVPIVHRGSLEDLMLEYGTAKMPWAKGMRETAAVLAKNGMPPDKVMSYDTHMPLLIHKEAMLETFELAKQVRTSAIHLRTLYGVVAGLSGVHYPDPKMLRRSDPFPSGPWLSSSPDTYRSTVEPVLRYLFPDASPYERTT